MGGGCTKETAFELLDYYYEKGGNVIDTANYYNGGESEIWLGEWLTHRRNRNDVVLITKFSSNYLFGSDLPSDDNTILSNYGGNNAKSLKLSLEQSLKQLNTTYIDILYVHWWDFTISPDEPMRNLNRWVENGTVLYLGASNMPAWFVVKCNAFAQQHGLAPFVVYSGKWNAAERDMESEILDMCTSEGMAVSPWEAVGGGKFKSPEQDSSQRMELYPDTVDRYKRVNMVLNDIAAAKGTLPTSIALAYVMLKQVYVFPLVGGKKVEYLRANIEALGVDLDEGEVKRIQDAGGWKRGAPYDILSFGGERFDGVEDVLQMTGIFDYVRGVEAIRPKVV